VKVGVNVGVGVEVGVDVGVGVNVEVGVKVGVGVRVASNCSNVRGLAATDTGVAVGLSAKTVGKTVAVIVIAEASALINRGASQKAISTTKTTATIATRTMPSVDSSSLDDSETGASGSTVCASGTGCTGSRQKNGQE
jgi:hypothetical protein